MVSNKMPIRIVIADDSPVFRRGLRYLLEADPALTVLGEATCGPETLSLARELNPDILLIDIFMGQLGGLNLLQALASGAPGVKTILVVGAIDHTQLVQAMQLGIKGLILKNADPAIYPKAIHRVQGGELWVSRDLLTEWAQFNAQASRKFELTPRELEIIAEVLAGSSNKQIAEKLGITVDTVKRHLNNIFDKLGLSTRLELSLFALHHHVLN